MLFVYSDLPSVLSGERLVFIDPSEECGRAWRLNKVQKRLRKKRKADQFKPYFSMLGKDKLCTGKYEGTVFRFPLRHEASKLSGTLYHHTHLTGLLDSFEAEAHLVLLFLKKLERISIHQRDEGNKRARPLFQVRITDDCVEEVRRERAEFRDKCQLNECDVHAAYMIHIETVKHADNTAPVVHRYSWFVKEFKAGEHVSLELHNLSKSETLSSIPLVGVAMDMSQRLDNADNSSAQSSRAVQGSLGQVFCHLPLSGEQRNPTGLPVHVNGYFAVSQNRRHLKWPTPDYKSGADESVDWNQCLLAELVPATYQDLIKKVIERSTNDTESLPPVMIYDALPDLATCDEKWRPAADELYRSLVDVPFIYTKARGGQWICVKDAIFVQTMHSVLMNDIVNDVLLECDANIVSVPHHVYEALMYFCPDVMTTLNPCLVRTVIQPQPESYNDRSWEDKLILLEYLLSDNNYQQLEG